LPTIGTKTSATARLNQSLRIFFSQFVRVSLRRPGQALFFARTVLWQAGAARRRAREAREGLHVPPIAIFGITNRCNLRCKGCYAQAIRGEVPYQPVDEAADLSVKPLVMTKECTEHLGNGEDELAVGQPQQELLVHVLAQQEGPLL
jgi:hypothetical protein